MNEINCHSIEPGRQELLDIRRQLYHSSGPGYVIFKGFIPRTYVDHLITFWTLAVDFKKTHKKFQGKSSIYFGCPNYYYHGVSVDNLTLRNFLWNQPMDMVSQSIVFAVQILRNSIMSKPIYHEIYPVNNRCLTPRFIVTKEGSPVPMHTDWGPGSGDFDPSRLQATLFLTKKGEDYQEGGFTFRLNNGDLVQFGSDVLVDPGDLVVWRYNNEHGVEGVSTNNNHRGFIRMIFPQETLHTKRISVPTWIKNNLIRTFK